MTLVGRLRLTQFARGHADVRRWLQAWVVEVEEASWNGPQDVKDRYQTASFLADNTIIFNVKGNRYRLICTVAYQTQVVVVRWIGTHADYSRYF